jgi:hypothetical protein
VKDARALEIRMAVLEASCAQSSSLKSTIRTLEDEYGPEVRAAFRQELDDLVVLERAALPEAKAVLSQTPPPTPRQR